VGHVWPARVQDEKRKVSIHSRQAITALRVYLEGCVGGVGCLFKVYRQPTHY
jgi:hypothetical protein